MRLRLTDEAKTDLADIRDYLEPRSMQGFTRVMSAIFTTMKQLESFPFLGRVGDVDGTRELSVPSTEYRLIYRINEPYHIDMVRVMHSKRKYPRN
jgi:addiction module RelE/StbE family toxin